MTVPRIGDAAAAGPVARLRTLRSVALRTPEASRAAEFYEHVWGLSRIDGGDGVAWLRGSGAEHHVLEVREAAQNALGKIAFSVGSPREVDEAARRLEALGIPPVAGPGPPSSRSTRTPGCAGCGGVCRSCRTCGGRPGRRPPTCARTWRASPTRTAGGRRRRGNEPVVISLLWFFAYYVNHGITAWLPSLYTKDFDLDLGTALRFTLLSNITGLLGCLIVALVIDRVGRRPALAVGMGGAAAALIALAVSGAASGGQVAVWASVATLFVYATNVSLYLYTPELYPTRRTAQRLITGRTEGSAEDA
ncbi:MFS transporter [Spirillospora sp. CA-255316]